ncbi:hypothetical protein D3C84_719240 [compost metagenome]
MRIELVGNTGGDCLRNIHVNAQLVDVNTVQRESEQGVGDVFQLGSVFEFQLDLARPCDAEPGPIIEVVEQTDIRASTPVCVLVAQLAVVGVAQPQHVVIDRYFSAEVTQHEARPEADR